MKCLLLCHGSAGTPEVSHEFENSLGNDYAVKNAKDTSKRIAQGSTYYNFSLWDITDGVNQKSPRLGAWTVKTVQEVTDHP